MFVSPVEETGYKGMVTKTQSVFLLSYTVQGLQVSYGQISLMLNLNTLILL